MRMLSQRLAGVLKPANWWQRIRAFFVKEPLISCLRGFHRLFWAVDDRSPLRAGFNVTLKMARLFFNARGNRRMHKSLQSPRYLWWRTRARHKFWASLCSLACLNDSFWDATEFHHFPGAQAHRLWCPSNLTAPTTRWNVFRSDPVYQVKLLESCLAPSWV